ncbi:hypothetical protein FHS42_005938 [Streptomyces zagrosensis]|uniref:Uncharacterized protein n=1 Tax=Streptomyces zagrosensis TaxID=1042984 RepID=A0A7W9QGK8_9ACTN|nr:hypothetical protein [Streptomyces zagrosensis]
MIDSPRERRVPAWRAAAVMTRQGSPAIYQIGSTAHVGQRHGTGRVPGTRCFNRDSAKGTLSDGLAISRQAIAYLEGNLWKPTLVSPGVYLLPS